MRISDWSSDVCSSDLWRRLDRRRLCRFSLGRIAVLRPGGRCQSQQDRNHRGAQEFFHHVWNPRLHSERVFAGFAGADAYGLVKVVDENLAVADLAGMSRLADRIDRGKKIDRPSTPSPGAVEKHQLNRGS